MKLTKKQALDWTIELWTFCAETGKRKEDWPGWERFGGLDENGRCENVTCLCFLCEQVDEDCNKCPYYKNFRHCYKPNLPFDKWLDAQTPKTRKKYALLFLEQVKSLK